MTMLEVLPQIPRYIAMRKGIGPKILPMNLVFAVTYRCNSRCQSCNIWSLWPQVWHERAEPAPGETRFHLPDVPHAR